MLLPRLAWGTLQSTSDIRPTAWGLLAACQQQGIVAQRFHSQAYVDRKDPVHVASRALRFLDAWLHSTAEISLAFLDGMRGANLGFVTGTWDDASFRKLTELLALPRVAVLDVAKHPPARCPILMLSTEFGCRISIPPRRHSVGRPIWQPTRQFR